MTIIIGMFSLGDMDIGINIKVQQLAKNTSRVKASNNEGTAILSQTISQLSSIALVVQGVDEQR